MGEVCCWGSTSEEGLNAALEECDPVHIRLPSQNHVYTVSGAVSHPVFAGLAADGSAWTRHYAYVLDEVTVTRPFRPRRAG